jgi:hypothetical protein
VEDILPLVREQFELANLIRVQDTSEMTSNFLFVATTLAKQMLETTNDAVLNTNTVLGYNLPLSFNTFAAAAAEEYEEAKSMIELGYFYAIGKGLIQSYRENKLPLPDPQKPLDAFFDTTGQHITEDTQLGGSLYSFPQAYTVFMKNLGKELKVKGRNLFHPIRLALTGEMSGQDVTKQLSLLSIVSRPDYNPLLNTDMVVTLSERMQRLESFLETIPEQFRSLLISKRSPLEPSRGNVFVAIETEEQYHILKARRRRHPPNFWSGLERIRAELILFWEETLQVPVLAEERDTPPIPNEMLLSFTNRHDLKYAINSVYGGRDALAYALAVDSKRNTPSRIIGGRWYSDDCINTREVRLLYQHVFLGAELQKSRPYSRPAAVRPTSHTSDFLDDLAQSTTKELTTSEKWRHRPGRNAWGFWNSTTVEREL